MAGEVLDEPHDLESVTVALVVDLPVEEVPWLGEPPGAQHWANGARLGKNPVVAPVALVRRAGVEPLHRPARAALGQHRRAGPGDARRAAAGRGDTVRLPAPEPAVLRSRLQDELAVSDRALRACTQTYERRRWAPGALEPHADALWRACRRLPRGPRRPRRSRPADPRRCPLPTAAEGAPSVPSPPASGALPWGPGGPMARQPAARAPRQRGRLVAAAHRPAPRARPPGRHRTAGAVRDAVRARHLLAAVPDVGRRLRPADAADDDPVRRRRA